MPELRRTRSAARPVLTGMVGGIGISPAVRLRARQHIVLVRVVPETVDRLALFGKRGGFGNIVALSRRFERVAVQIAKVLSDARSLGVIPGAVPDAVPRI